VERFIQVLVDGIATGSIYAAVALALVLIFRSTGIVNFAQGEMAMFSTFLAWGLYEAGLSIGLAVLTTLVLSFVAGMVIERGLIRHFEGGEVLTLVIVTLGLFILLNSLAGWIWGFGNRSFPSLFGDSTFTLGGVRLTVESVGIVAVLLGVVGLLFLLFQRTKIGLAMRAAALNPESSGLVGVRVGRMLMLGWGLAAALGAVSGLFTAAAFPPLEPTMMQAVLIYAFAAAVLGGIDSPLGAVVGGLSLGVFLNVVGTYSDDLQDAGIPIDLANLRLPVAFVFILLVLLVRPQGLFGRAAVREV
jgi:branched-chain amino acid transport system permease protein